MPGLIDSPTGLSNLLAPGSGLIWISGGLSPPGGLGPPSVTDAVIDRFEANILDRFGSDIFTRVVSPTVPSWVLVGGGVPATLDLNFTSNAAWNNGVDTTPAALLTVTRASSGYYVQANGTFVNFPNNNTLRIGSNGLLVEESRTNLALTSGDFSAAQNNWGTPGTSFSSITAATTCLKGGETAWAHTDNAGGSRSRAQTFTLANNTNYTLTAILEQNLATGTATSNIGLFDNTAASFKGLGNYAWNSDTWSTSQGALVASGSTKLGVGPNGGQLRILWVCVASDAVHTNHNFYIYPNGVPSNTATTIIHAAQMEQASFPTSYIPTTGSTATRAAETVTLNSVAGLVSTVSIYAKYQIADTTLRHDTFGYGPTAAGSYMSLQSQSAGGSVTLGWFASGTTAFGTATTNTIIRVAGAFDGAGNASGSMNGGAIVAAANSDYTGAATSINLGGDAGGSQFLDGYINRFAFWNSKLANSALVTLSTQG